MTGSVHAAIGAALGRRIKHPAVAFVAGVVSHFIGDVVPHRDLGSGEVPILGATMLAIARRHGVNSAEFWGAMGGIVPDFEHIPTELRRDPRRFEPMETKWFPTHNGKVQHGEWPLPHRWGVLMQIGLFITGLYLAGTLSRRP